MRRISSLPTAEFCPRVDTIGLDVETTQSARSTVFHEYCATGKWSADLMTLPEADREEIQKWRIPLPFNYLVGGVPHILQYSNSKREWRVAVDKDFNAVDVPADIPQSEIAKRYPQVMIAGHIDMAWVLPDHNLVIICDIKSSIFAVSDGTRSLQLHGYGLAACAVTGIGRYVTGIWDASEGKYHVSREAVEVDSFEAADIKDRIRRASADREGAYRIGTHCGSCWKRSHCPAHLVDVPEGEFKAVLSGQATEKDVREALVKKKQLEDLQKAVDQACKMWVKQHGPVRSEDGTKWYRCELRSRSSYDYDAIAAALGVEDLSNYKKTTESAHHDWRKID